MPSLFCETDSETIKVTRVDYRAKKSENVAAEQMKKWIYMNLRENKR